MSSLIGKMRRMSYTGTDQHSAVTHSGFAVTAKHMAIENKGSRVKSSKKEISWRVGLCRYGLYDMLVVLVGPRSNTKTCIFVFLCSIDVLLPSVYCFIVATLP